MPQPDTLQQTLAAAQQASPILSPSAMYLELDDELRVTCLNGATGVQLEIRSRILGVGRKVQTSRDFLTPATNRTSSSTIVSTDEGWLIGGEIVVAAGTPLAGQCYVLVEIVRGLAASAQQYQAIAAGYVTAKVPLAFPGVPLGMPTDGAGALRMISGTAPGAGNEISETVPTGARWQLMHFGTLLTTSAAAANRVPAIVLDDGANVSYAYAVGINETASLVWQNYFAPAVAPATFAASNLAIAPLPAVVMLSAGARIRTSTAAIQAGDVYAAPRYVVREWIEGL